MGRLRPSSLTIITSVVLGLFFSCAKKTLVATNQLAVGPQKPHENPGCEEKLAHDNLCFTWGWLEKAESTHPGKLFLKLFRPNHLDNSPVYEDTRMQIQVTLWMPSMGHGSIPTILKQVDRGTYLVENVVFIMPGAWDIHFKFYDPTTTNLMEEKIVSYFHP